MMSIGVIVFFVWILIFVIRAIMSSAGSGNSARDHLRRAQEDGLSVRCTQDVIYPENEGDPLPIIRVNVSGAIAVPYENFSSMIRVWLLDVTDSQSEPHPVLCMIPDLSDDDGIYTNDQQTTIPYQMAEVSDMEVAVIPSFALLLPKKGSRCLRVCVAITPAQGTEPIYAYGSTMLAHTQETTGYTEFKQRTLEQERRVAMLAFSLSAADGRIDSRETAAIRRFFADHLADKADEDERKARVDQTLKDTLAAFKSGQEKPVSLIKRLCQEIVADDDPSLVQTAYELCVQVAATDDDIAEVEQKGLKYIANNLKLPPEFVRETHDRYLRLSMFEKKDDQAVLDMPQGLTVEEKIEFLNQEYRKWRSRAAHKDPAVATEANVRLQQITRARRELQEA